MKNTKKNDLPAEIERSVRRILVALDTSNQSAAALEAAARLAEQMQAELLGMFVEDVDLLHLSGLPFAREVGLMSASSRMLSGESMVRSLRARADRARATLESIAEKHRLQVSFKVTRGNVLLELLAASNEVDLVAVGTSGYRIGLRHRVGSTCRGVVQESKCSVLLLQENIVPGRTVLALFDGSVSSEKTLRMAGQLAEAQNDRLVVILLASDAELEKRKEHAARVLADTVETQYQQLDTRQLGTLPDLLQTEHCGVLLVSEQSCHSAGLEPDSLARLQCPVLLVR